MPKASRNANAPVRVTGYQVRVDTDPDGDAWSDEEIYKFAPGRHVHHRGPIAAFRSRSVALETRNAILRVHPNVLVRIYELTTADPEDDDRDDEDFVLDPEKVFVAPSMLKARGGRAPRHAPLPEKLKIESAAKQLGWSGGDHDGQ